MESAMKMWFIAMLICLTTVYSFGQTTSSQYQTATITAVNPHTGETGRYDVSLKVGNDLYVVAYTPPNGANRVEYSAGMDLLVLVGSKTITFSKYGKTTEVPILHHEQLPASSNFDLAKAPSQYFSLKMQNLTEKLSLTADQQAKIKPIVEQESGELNYLWGNPVVSQDQKVKDFEKIVRSSDEKLKPILTPAQLEKLQTMRTQQKAELKKRLAEQKSANKK
jgi:Spy/CpxP family protein refolding chaperone